MKKPYMLLFLLPAFIFAQPKGVNTIIVHGVSFSLIDDSLNAKGFEIDKLDSVSLTTKSKQYYSIETDSKKDHGNIVITVKMKGTDAIITARYTYDELETKVLGTHTQSGKPTTVENSYSKTSFMRRAFDYMDDFAKSLGGTVSYERH